LHARLHTLETTPEAYEQGLEIIRDQLLPWARDSTGFRGLIGLVDRTRETSLILTLWADREALELSAPAAKELSRLTATVTGANVQSIDEYEVGLLEVAP
jgi:hypothetical protein